MPEIQMGKSEGEFTHISLAYWQIRQQSSQVKEGIKNTLQIKKERISTEVTESGGNFIGL